MLLPDSIISLTKESEVNKLYMPLDGLYHCYQTNFGSWYLQPHKTLEAAIEYGKSKGFEFSVWKDGVQIGHASGVSLQWFPLT